MKTLKRIFDFTITVSVIAVCMAGCAGKSKEFAGQSVEPDWVRKGTYAAHDVNGDAFYGVGSVWGIKNPSLMRTTSENRARAEIAKLFKNYTASLMRDYQMSAMAGDTEVSTEEVHVEQTIKTFSKAKLSGVMIIDHWKDPETGEFFALACMKLDEFEEFLKHAEELSESLRKRVLENSEKAFKRLENEEQRHE